MWIQHKATQNAKLKRVRGQWAKREAKKIKRWDKRSEYKKIKNV